LRGFTDGVGERSVEVEVQLELRAQLHKKYRDARVLTYRRAHFFRQLQVAEHRVELESCYIVCFFGFAQLQRLDNISWQSCGRTAEHLDDSFLKFGFREHTIEFNYDGDVKISSVALFVLNERV
jgi:hypothetical protein